MFTLANDDNTNTVTQIPQAMLATLQGQLNKEVLQHLRANLLAQAESAYRPKAIIELTGISSMGKHDYLFLLETARMLQIMGVKTILVGMRPGIIAGLSMLGLDLSQIPGECDLERALE